MQPFEERIEVVIGGDHDRPPTRREDAAVLGRVQVLRCAPPLRAPSATWTRPARGSRAAAIVGGRSASSNGSGGIGVPEIVRDVLGADRLLGEAALEGRAQRGVAVRLQERVQPLDIADPRARAPMRELGEIRERRGAEIEQMLALQIAPRALAGDGRHALRAVLGQDRARARAGIAAHARR